MLEIAKFPDLMSIDTKINQKKVSRNITRPKLLNFQFSSNLLKFCSADLEIQKKSIGNTVLNKCLSEKCYTIWL